MISSFPLFFSDCNAFFSGFVFSGDRFSLCRSHEDPPHCLNATSKVLPLRVPLRAEMAVDSYDVTEASHDEIRIEELVMVIQATRGRGRFKRPPFFF